MMILTFQVFPALYNWVAQPIVVLMKALYQHERSIISNNILPSPFRIELLASLERLLYYCHTGNASVLATSLMHSLGLGRAVIKDGFPMIVRLFEQPMISMAMKQGLHIDARRWPLKDGYPAVASKRAQVLTYSPSHFQVSLTHTSLFYSLCMGHVAIHYDGLFAACATRYHTRQYWSIMHCATIVFQRVLSCPYFYRVCNS
jgi:hypothetical protein